MNGIGEKAGLPASTISRLIRTGATTEGTVKAVAKALRISEADVLAATKGESLGPWTPPLEAHMLNDKEREALSLLIRSITQGRTGGSSDDDRQSEAQKSTQPPTSGGEHHGTGQHLTSQAGYTLAARRTKSAGKHVHEQLDELEGEE